MSVFQKPANTSYTASIGLSANVNTMNKAISFRFGVIISLAMLGGIGYRGVSSATSPVSVNPARMPALGTVDQRFQSYNVEMLEVTGGRFWKPY